MNKFKNINYVAIIAMLMIVGIHYFNYFAKYVDGSIELNIMYLIRGAALPAVVVYLTNTAYTSFYLKKGMNFRSLVLFIIIPTLMFQQLQHYMFGLDPVYFNLSEGFNGSWFGEMYVTMMLLVPFVLYWDSKNKYVQNGLLALSILLTVFGYWYSLVFRTSTINSMELWMAIPYVGLTYLLYRIIKVGIKYIDSKENLSRMQIIMGILIVIMIILEALAYAGMLPSKQVSSSYYSPVTIIFSVSLWLLVYSLDLSKLPNVRNISRGSYFFFFTHYLMIRSFEFYFPNLPENYVWLCFFVTIIGAYILSTLTFAIYQFVTVKVLKL